MHLSCSRSKKCSNTLNILRHFFELFHFSFFFFPFLPSKPFLVQPYLPKSVLAPHDIPLQFRDSVGGISQHRDRATYFFARIPISAFFIVFSDMQIIDMVGLPRTASRSPAPNSFAYSLKALLMLHRPKFTPDSDMVSKSFSSSLGVLVVASSSRGLEFSFSFEMHFTSWGAGNALVWLVFRPVR